MTPKTSSSSSLLMMSENTKAKQIKCFFCKKLGHRASECRKKQRIANETFRKPNQPNSQHGSTQRNDRNRSSGDAHQQPLNAYSHAYSNHNEYRNRGPNKPNQLRMMKMTRIKGDEVTTAMSRDVVDLLQVSVQLNGQTRKAYLDCGATTSTLSTRAARQQGAKLLRHTFQVKYFNVLTDKTKGIAEYVCVELSSVVVNQIS